jgi:hypothetical protein
MILAGWAVRAGTFCTWIRHHSSGKDLGQSPYVQHRSALAQLSYATTLLSAFGWRRRPALRDKDPFSSKWPKDGLRSPSTPRRRKQDRHFVRLSKSLHQSHGRAAAKRSGGKVLSTSRSLVSSRSTSAPCNSETESRMTQSSLTVLAAEPRPDQIEAVLRAALGR